MNFLRNPYLGPARTYFHNMLKDKYASHDEVVERIMQNLTVTKDAEAFFKLIAEVYDAGYTQCVNQYKEELAKHGLKVKITKPK